MSFLGSCGSQGVAMHLLNGSECIYNVACHSVLGGCQGITMQLLRCSKSFLMCCNAISRVLRELRCCYAVAKVLWEFLWSCHNILVGCQGFAMQVLQGSKSFLMCCYAVFRVLWELRCCYAVTKVFQIIFSVLLCGCHSIVSCLIASL